MNNVIISNIRTLPTRQNTMKKNRGRSSVQRSFSMMNSGGDTPHGTFDDAEYDTKSIISEAGSSTFDGSSVKRKDKKYRQSFLKKTMSKRY